MSCTAAPPTRPARHCCYLPQCDTLQLRVCRLGLSESFKPRDTFCTSLATHACHTEVSPALLAFLSIARVHAQRVLDRTVLGGMGHLISCC